MGKKREKPEKVCNMTLAFKNDFKILAGGVYTMHIHTYTYTAPVYSKIPTQKNTYKTSDV